jgi:hypothetical protein
MHLTYHTYSPSDSLASSEAGAPASEPAIEITPVMIEAGVAVLYESGAIEHPLRDNDRYLVREIFHAMLQAKRACLEPV